MEMKKEREEWIKQREEFNKLQDEDGKKLDSVKYDILTGADFAQKTHGQNSAKEREVWCLLDQQVAAKADCDRIMEQRDGELRRVAEARVDGVREKEDRAIRLWDLQDQIPAAVRRRNKLRENNDGEANEEKKRGDASMHREQTEKPGFAEYVEAIGEDEGRPMDATSGLPRS